MFRAQSPSSDAIEQTSTEHVTICSYSTRNDTRSSVGAKCICYKKQKERIGGKQVVTEEVQEERKKGREV